MELEKNGCKSVYKSGGALPSKEALTQAWAAVINGSERAKAALSIEAKRDA